MKVEKNKVVTVTYVLKVDNGETGLLPFEEVTEKYPFVFLFGAGGVLPGLEDAMNGKSVGETFSVFLDFENGYGDYDETKKVIIPKSNFKEEGKKNKSKAGKQSSINNAIRCGNIFLINNINIYIKH
jgi:FKBP-type peptidyl-prolyl cis-trans isomerase SlyD